MTPLPRSERQQSLRKVMDEIPPGTDYYSALWGAASALFAVAEAARAKALPPDIAAITGGFSPETGITRYLWLKRLAADGHMHRFPIIGMAPNPRGDAVCLGCDTTYAAAMTQPASPDLKERGA